MQYYNPSEVLAPRPLPPTDENGDILPGWIQLTTPQEIANAEAEIAALIAASQPPPPPDIAGFLTDCVPSFTVLMGWLAGQNPGMASVIQVATSRLDSGSLPLFIGLWNQAFDGCDADPTIPSAINAAAAANRVPVAMGEDFMLTAT
jgi:hypothetical protein